MKEKTPSPMKIRESAEARTLRRLHRQREAACREWGRALAHREHKERNVSSPSCWYCNYERLNPQPPEESCYRVCPRNLPGLPGQNLTHGDDSCMISTGRVDREITALAECRADFRSPRFIAR